MTVMEGTHRWMLEELHRQDNAGERAAYELTYHLVDVVDYTKRLNDCSSRHYRADKSGPLVAAAQYVRRVAIQQYGAWLRSDPNAPEATDDASSAEDAIYRLTELARSVDQSLEAAMWAAAQGRPLYVDQVDRLRNAAGEVRALVDELARNAIPWEE